MTPPGRADVPPSFADRLRALAAGEPPAEARDAATVVLLRDGVDGLQVHLLHRASSMAFAAGMQVFPGGRVDPADEVTPLPWRGPSAESLAPRLRCDTTGARALVVAAVRETFEEAGVLLASAPGEDAVVTADGEEWEALRLRLEAHELPLATVLADRGLELRADLLQPWAHWVTPEAEPRRYDTRFLVAVLPAGTAARHVGDEAVARDWWRPADALAAGERGEVALMPPTVAVLGEVAAFPDAASVLRAAPSRSFPVVMPRFALDDDGQVRLLMPEEQAGTA